MRKVIYHNKPKKQSISDTVFSIVNGFFLIVLALICILPMWHVIMGSISNPKALYVNKDFLFFPTGGIDFETWGMVWKKYPILRGYLNTILYTLLSTSIGLLLSLLGAYVLSKKNFLFQKPLFIFIFVPMFITAGMIPQYVVAYNLHLTDTIWGIVLTGCCNALNILLLKKGIDAIPYECLEAAELDGASHIHMLFRIIVPLIIPSISVIVMFGIINQWNSWIIPSIYLSEKSSNLYPLALIVRNILDETNGNGTSISINTNVEYSTSIQMVSIVMSSLPLLIIYPFVQKYFEKAVIVGGVKG